MKMHARLNRCRRGFSLTELLHCLPMIAFAGLLAVRLFGASMHVIAVNAQDPNFQLQQMSQALKIDAWGARSIDVPDAANVVITNTDGKKVEWQFAEHQITRREGESAARHWTTPTQFSPRRQAGALVLGSGSDQWRFTAPMLAEAK